MTDRRALMLILCALLMPAANAQVNPPSRPNFSGEWVLQSPADPPADTSHTLNIEHDAIYISITKTTGDRSEVVQHRLNPSVVGGSVRGAGERTFAGVWWFGDVLRFDQGDYSGPEGPTGTYFERSEVWSLDDDGLLTIQITRRSSGGSRSRVTLVYRKQRK